MLYLSTLETLHMEAPYKLTTISFTFIIPHPTGRGIKRWCASDVCLSDDSVAYIGPKSRTERPRKTRIGTEVANVTRDSDTTFKVKGQGHQAAFVGCSSQANMDMQFVTDLHACIMDIMSTLAGAGA